MGRSLCPGLGGGLTGRPGREFGTMLRTVVVVGLEREARIVEPMLGLGIQSRGITLGAGIGRGLKRLAGIAHGLHRHGHATRKNEHTSYDKN